MLLVLVSQFRFARCAHVSGIITENTRFFYRKLPVAPSVRATIQFNVSYIKSLVKNLYPLMGIYTSYPKRNIEKQCSFIKYGQLHNENLHPFLKTYEYKSTICKMSGADIVKCQGRFDIQDYIPRNFSLSFGFPCDWLSIYSLQGLQYNISFSIQSNGTNRCINYSVLPLTGVCSRFYNETSVPNLIGDEHVDRIVKYFRNSIFFEAILFEDATCYQYLYEVACHMVLPKCDPVKQVTHPCREMCWDFVEGCWQKYLDFLARMGSEFTYVNRNHLGFMSSAEKSQIIDCDYLPSLHGSVTCFYKPVRCNSPPEVTYGTRILNATQRDVY